MLSFSGQGFARYAIQPKPGLPDGTVISARAHVRLDNSDWVALPQTGPVELTILPCPATLRLSYQSDFDADGFLTALDLSAMIDILFAGQRMSGILTVQSTRGFRL